MKSRIIPVLVASVLALGVIALAPPASAAPPDSAGPPERVRVVVELDRKGSADEVIRSVGKSARNVHKTSTMPYVIMEVPRTALKGLAHNPHVRGVVEDFADAPALASSLPVINGDDVQTLGFTGAGATVAILDSGIDADHPYFGSRIVAQHCFSDPDDDDGDPDEASLCPDGTTEDTSADIDSDNNASCVDGGANICDHGTHVAGIAAGSAGDDAAGSPPGNGAAPDAQIIAVQVFTRVNTAAGCMPNPAPCVLAYVSDQIEALDWVRGQAAANPGWNVVASNMSLGGGDFSSACDGDTRKAAIDANLAAGIATVIASGNNTFLNSVGAPGCISTAFTVGRTNDDDTTTNSGNRGPLLDVMAPGSGIDSAIDDDVYGSKSGTSMSTPFVSGALAVLRSAYPTRAVTDLMNDITSTGVPITYATNAAGTTTNTTPRLDLLAALQSANAAPTVTTDAAAVSIDEGSQVTNTGTVSDSDGTITALTASIGTVTQSGSTWEWSYTPPDGPADTTVTITATDDKGETGQASFDLHVDNVAPTVVIDAVTPADENAPVSLEAHFTDPGTVDTHTASVDWGDGSVTAATIAGGIVTATHVYGDDGAFPVTVTVTDKDGGSGSDADSATVANVAPTAEITGPATTSWNGQDIVFGTAGEPVDFTARGTDPGSDDLTFAWDYGDGATDVNVHLVNPPAVDGDPSPSIQPRDVTDAAPHTYAIACAATTGVEVADDDGGAASDAVQVIILGTSTDAGTLGVWQTDYRDKRNNGHTADEKACLLSVVRVLSAVFDEVTPLTTTADAVAALWPKHTNNAEDQFEAHLLSLWLNVADGAIALDDPVDSNGDGTADTTVGAIIQAAEAERTAPTPSQSALEAYKNLFEAVNAAA